MLAAARDRLSRATSRRKSSAPASPAGSAPTPLSSSAATSSGSTLTPVPGQHHHLQTPRVQHQQLGIVSSLATTVTPPASYTPPPGPPNTGAWVPQRRSSLASTPTGSTSSSTGASGSGTPGASTATVHGPTARAQHGIPVPRPYSYPAAVAPVADPVARPGVRHSRQEAPVAPAQSRTAAAAGDPTYAAAYPPTVRVITVQSAAARAKAAGAPPISSPSSSSYSIPPNGGSRRPLPPTPMSPVAAAGLRAQQQRQQQHEQEREQQQMRPSTYHPVHGHGRPVASPPLGSVRSIGSIRARSGSQTSLRVQYRGQRPTVVLPTRLPAAPHLQQHHRHQEHVGGHDSQYIDHEMSAVARTHVRQFVLGQYATQSAGSSSSYTSGTSTSDTLAVPQPRHAVDARAVAPAESLSVALVRAHHQDQHRLDAHEQEQQVGRDVVLRRRRSQSALPALQTHGSVRSIAGSVYSPGLEFASSELPSAGFSQWGDSRRGDDEFEDVWDEEDYGERQSRQQQHPKQQPFVPISDLPVRSLTPPASWRYRSAAAGDQRHDSRPAVTDTGRGRSAPLRASAPSMASMATTSVGSMESMSPSSRRGPASVAAASRGQQVWAHQSLTDYSSVRSEESPVTATTASGPSPRSGGSRPVPLSEYMDSSRRASIISSVPTMSTMATATTPGGTLRSSRTMPSLAPVLTVTPSAAHVKLDEKRNRLGGCVVLAVRVAGVPEVASDPAPMALLGSPREPTVLVQGKAWHVQESWAWMGAEAEGSLEHVAPPAARDSVAPSDSSMGGQILAGIRSSLGQRTNLRKVPSPGSLRGHTQGSYGRASGVGAVARASVRGGGTGAPALRNMDSMRSIRSVTFAEGTGGGGKGSSSSSSASAAAKKHIVQLNFEFPRNKLVEARCQLLLSIKCTLTVGAVKIQYTIQAPIQWVKPTRISFKRVPSIEVSRMVIRKEALHKSIGHNLSFRFPSMKAVFQAPDSKPAAALTQQQQTGRAPISSRTESIVAPVVIPASLRHMSSRAALGGSVRKRISHTNILASMAARSSIRYHVPPSVQYDRRPESRTHEPARSVSPPAQQQPVLFHRRRRSRLPDDWLFAADDYSAQNGPPPPGPTTTAATTTSAPIGHMQDYASGISGASGIYAPAMSGSVRSTHAGIGFADDGSEFYNGEYHDYGTTVPGAFPADGGDGGRAPFASPPSTTSKPTATQLHYQAHHTQQPRYAPQHQHDEDEYTSASPPAVHGRTDWSPADPSSKAARTSHGADVTAAKPKKGGEMPLSSPLELGRSVYSQVRTWNDLGGRPVMATGGAAGAAGADMRMGGGMTGGQSHTPSVHLQQSGGPVLAERMTTTQTQQQQQSPYMASDSAHPQDWSAAPVDDANAWGHHYHGDSAPAAAGGGAGYAHDQGATYQVDYAGQLVMHDAAGHPHVLSDYASMQSFGTTSSHGSSAPFSGHHGPYSH